MFDGRGGLDVEATIPPGFGGSFEVDDEAAPFVEDVVVASAGAARRATRGTRGAWDLASCTAGCAVRYKVDLAEASARIADLGTARRVGDLLEAPPSTWILAPREAPEETRIVFRVRVPDGQRFVTGVFPAAAGDGVYALTWDDLRTSPYSAFGRVRTVDVEAGGAVLTLALAGAFDLGDDVIAAWLRANAAAVAAYFGKFPVPRALVLLAFDAGDDIGLGKSLSGGGASVFLSVGAQAKKDDLDRDWVLAHELVHIGFPAQPRYRDWMEEGLATYVEPLARAQAGLQGDDVVWRGFLLGMRFGLPEADDQGLDRTHTWGRVYWGGALFYLVCDLEIRRRTKGARSLEDALAAIVARGGNNAVRWPAAQTLEVGDAATGTTVLTETFRAWSEGPAAPQLNAIYKYLGVSLEEGGGRVLFDDAAPGAAVRKAMTRRRGTLAAP